MRIIVTILLAYLLTALAHAQQPLDDIDIEDIDTSYIYPVVLGTGSYKIDGRQLSMLTLPFAVTQQRVEEPDHDLGVKWYIPTTIGYDQIEDTDWLDNILGEELVTLSIMPGVQFTIPLNDTWKIRPFGQVGIGHDFISNETYVLGALGIRALGTWRFDNGWQLRWGASARLAGEYQFDSERNTSLGLLETGVDARKDLNVSVRGHPINMGVYYILQSFQPEWTLGRFLSDRSNVHEIHELGLSIGLQKPRKILGVYVSRVRMGYKEGSGFRGISFGTEFPF